MSVPSSLLRRLFTFGPVVVEVEAGVAVAAPAPRVIPRAASDRSDHSEPLASRRRDFATRFSGAALAHLGRYSFDPALTRCNIEHFAGVAQVPLGIAGPCG